VIISIAPFLQRRGRCGERGSETSWGGAVRRRDLAEAKAPGGGDRGAGVVVATGECGWGERGRVKRGAAETAAQARPQVSVAGASVAGSSAARGGAARRRYRAAVNVPGGEHGGAGGTSAFGCDFGRVRYGFNFEVDDGSHFRVCRTTSFSFIWYY